MIDLGLAAVHHILVFGLVIMLAMELAILRGSPVDVRRLSRLDGGYGLTSVLVIAVGVARIVWGAKGWVAYADNPFFWGKMAAFALVGAMSVPPTVTFIRWSRAAKADAAFQPPAAEIAGATRWVRLEVLLIIVLVAAAAGMARWPL